MTALINIAHMKNNKCIGCSEYRNCRDSFSSWVFFIIGLIATVAVRVVTVLIDVNPVYGKIAWYIGVGGFFIFFVYKFKVSQLRSKLISQNNLLDKIGRQEQLNQEDYNLINALLCGLSSKKEKINYFFIFGLSAIVLILAIYMDLFR